MPRDPHHDSGRAASVSLAAEAALLEARLRMLREELDTVDARIQAVSEALRQLRRPAASAEPDSSEAHGGPTSHDGAASGPDDTCLTWLDGSIACSP